MSAVARTAANSKFGIPLSEGNKGHVARCPSAKCYTTRKSFPSTRLGQQGALEHVAVGTRISRSATWVHRQRSAKSANYTSPARSLIQRSAVAVATAPAEDAAKFKEVFIPQSIHDISNGDRILGFGADLGEDHPGYHDEEYKRRRMEIVAIARQHKIGEPIPRIQYTAEETAVWGQVLVELSKLYPTHACRQFLDTFPLFDFRPDQIPQLQDMSEILQKSTGWQIRPVAGLLHPRDFLNGLAFRTFHSTQYIRHGSNPMYTPEPDVCHELLGHVPMLADPEFADLAYSIGVASLGASEKQIWHLTKLYWYTVEFGTVMEDGQVKAFGAGLLSSFGELQWLHAGANGRFPTFAELDPFAKLPKMSYKDGFQSKYFLCNSFSDVATKLRAYAKSIQRVHLEGTENGVLHTKA